MNEEEKHKVIEDLSKEANVSHEVSKKIFATSSKLVMDAIEELENTNLSDIPETIGVMKKQLRVWLPDE